MRWIRTRGHTPRHLLNDPPRRPRSRAKFLLIALGLFAALLPSFGLPAAAVHDTGLFELDGNATHNTTDDWDNVCHQVTVTQDTTDALTDECTTVGNTNGAKAVAWASDGDSNATIFTGGGSKDPQDVSSWAWKDGAGGLPDKDNLVHAFAARYSIDETAHCSDGDPNATKKCDVIFFGSDRFDNSGDAQQGFWFFQNEIGLGTNAVGGGTGFTGVHTAGDLLVISDFSNGGTTSTITVYKWDPTCKKAAGTCGDVNLRTLETSDNAKCASSLGDNDAFCGIVNPAETPLTDAPWSFTDKSGNHDYLNGELYEGGINLSTLGLADRCFASVASETRSSTSTTATLKDFVLGGFGHCTTDVTTTPKQGDGTTAIPSGGLSIGTGSVTAKDSAAISVNGTSTWAGTFKFFICGPIPDPPVTTPPTPLSTCNTGGLQIGSTLNITQATAQPIVPDAAATLTSAGRYCWRGEFDASTANVPDDSDSSLTECFTVNPVTPTLTTTAGADVDLGQAVTDTASLSGTSKQPGTNGPNATYPSINATNGANAGGSITFTLKAAGSTANTCGANATGTGTNPQTYSPVNGNGTYPPTPPGPASFTPSSPGTYYWVATYTKATGDPNNVGSTHDGNCNVSAEDVVVRQAQTAITTRQFVFPQDKARLTAPTGGTLTGTLVFRLYDSSTTCAANGGTTATGMLYTETFTINDASGVTKTTNNLTARVTSNTTVFWRVTYTSTNQAQLGTSSVCTESTQLIYAGNDTTNITIP